MDHGLPGSIAAYKIIMKPPFESPTILWYEEKSTKDSIIMVCPSFWFANSFAKAIMLRRKIKNKINNLFYITEFSNLVLSATQKESISVKGTLEKEMLKVSRDDSCGGQGDHSSILPGSLGFKTTSPAF